MTSHDHLCPWVSDPNAGPRHLCAWCDVIGKARADATMVADAMITQAKNLADESSEALAAAIRIIWELRNDIADTAAAHGLPADVIDKMRGKP